MPEPLDECWVVADRLVDGRGERVLREAAIRVRQGRIVELREGAAARVPLEGPVVTLEGCTVLPGLINVHAHLCLDASFNLVKQLEADSDLTLMARMVGNAQAALGAGVTLMKDNGGRGESTVALRDAVATGLVDGPDLLVAGVSISNEWSGVDTRVARTADEIRQQGRAQLEKGADCLHLFGSGMRMSGGNRGRSRYSVEEFRAAVETAGEFGKPVFVDTHATEGARFAVEAGVRALEHCHWIGEDGRVHVPEDLLDRMATREVFVVPTLAVSYQRREGPADAEPSWRHDPLLGPFEARARVVAQMHLGGVHVVAGSDAGAYGTRFDEFAYELELLARCGMSPLAVIAAATSVAARCLGRDADVGTIAVGKQADLVAVAGDPIQDLGALWDVRAVMKRGRLIRLSPAVDAGRGERRQA